MDSSVSCQEENLKATFESDVKEEIKIEENELIDSSRIYISEASRDFTSTIAENVAEHDKLGRAGQNCSFKCCYCESVFFREIFLIQHIEKMHGNIKCPHCYFVTTSYYRLKTHIWEHENNDSCDVCGKNEYLTLPLFSFKVCSHCKKNQTETELRKILAKKTNNTLLEKSEKEIEVQNTTIQTNTIVLSDDDNEDYLEENTNNDVDVPDAEMTLFHQKKAAWYNCMFCSYTTRTLDYLVKHQNNRHSDEKSEILGSPPTAQLYKCKLCYFSTPKRKHFQEHKKKTHDTFTCKVCNVTLSAELLKSHMWEHENHKICDICGNNEYLTLSIFSRQVCTQCKKGKTEAELRELLADSNNQSTVEFEQVYINEQDSEEQAKNDSKSKTINAKEHSNLKELTLINPSSVENQKKCRGRPGKSFKIFKCGFCSYHTEKYAYFTRHLIIKHQMPHRKNIVSEEASDSNSKSLPEHFPLSNTSNVDVNNSFVTQLPIIVNFNDLQQSDRPSTPSQPNVSPNVQSSNNFTQNQNGAHAQYVNFGGSQQYGGPLIMSAQPMFITNNIFPLSGPSTSVLNEFQPIQPAISQKQEQKFDCVTCGFETETYMAYWKHTQDINTYVCYDFCPRTFTSLPALEIHILEIHKFRLPEKCETFKCISCCYSSILQPKVLNHQNMAHIKVVNHHATVSLDNNSSKVSNSTEECQENINKKGSSSIVLDLEEDNSIFKITRNLYCSDIKTKNNVSIDNSQKDNVIKAKSNFQKRNNDDFLFVNVGNDLNKSDFITEEDPETIELDDDDVDVQIVDRQEKSLQVLDRIANKYKTPEQSDKNSKKTSAVNKYEKFNKNSKNNQNKVKIPITNNTNGIWLKCRANNSCNFKCKDRDVLNIHKTTMHGSREIVKQRKSVNPVSRNELYPCSECELMFKNMVAYLDHKKYFHQSNITIPLDFKVHKCQQYLCDFETLIEGELNVHIKNHMKLPQTFNCSYCNYTSNSEGLLSSHEWDHKNNDLCDICGHNDYLTLSFFSHKVCTLCKKDKTDSELKAALLNKKGNNKNLDNLSDVIILDD